MVEDGQEVEFGTTGDVELSFNDSDAVLDIKRVTGTPDLRIADDMKLNFGNTKDASIYYDETTSDKIQVEGADWNYATGVTANYADTTDASNVATAAFTVAGGIGVGATTWEVVKKVVLPYTKIGVVGGVMLGLGRALGETMAVTFVIGNAHRLSVSYTHLTLPTT